MQFVDQLQRTVVLPKTPERIVSLVPSQTELLVDLGLRENLVGITKFCVHPADLRKHVKIVGGTKQVHFDRIEALKPDIIICNKEENTLEMVVALEKIAPVWISDINRVEDSLEMVQRLGEVFKVGGAAELLIKRISEALEEFQIFIKNFSSRKTVYIIWKDPFMAAGRNTFINDLLNLNRFENMLISENSRYPEITLNELEKAELILLSTEPYPFKPHHVLELQKKLNRTVKLVDGEYFSWYGSRMAAAFEYFKTLH
jgi:ABC-type Fe3+-hydroxamate transport system substrate-binding protein